ncbi:beta-ketoacyl-[acyl-carrier-protein] synthase family protein [Streptomyces sp. BE147]|uniref:beta-ketoacyl-[acyl-carrier-protein] synthase family protein n=1 Tax=Streptomyces sp. BE147 TaxID=3002524 RepID=UPI002E78F3AE|nr:beta-ketoacyl-[acyl-carrier-protein] synthase family protein [Streptomyces sp. BE147]MEE1737872.1 beta-ketoacyl-[acyl-carrier-protein] synthase family protein [Streptomyces sp. BE147]
MNATVRDHAGRWRVAVTGMGVKTPAGCDLSTFTDTVFAGRPTAAKVTRFDVSGLASQIACEVPGFDAEAYVSGKVLRRMDRCTQFGFNAALDALADAGSPTVEPERAGIAFGSSYSGLQSAYEASTTALTSGARFVSPFLSTMIMSNAPAAYLGLELGWHGPSATLATACATGTQILNVGAQMIRNGECDLVLAGAAEANCQLLMATFSTSGALSTRNDDPSVASRPFDDGRDGYVMGEGAACLVLERYDRALARRARIYAEVAGGAHTTDSHHISAPHPEGRWTGRCMAAAIADAGLLPADIRQVNCHATSTPLGDVAEARALLAAFDGAPPPVTGSKGVFGHLLGAAGAAEAVVSVLSAGNGLVPPTAGHSRLGPDCAGIDVVTGSVLNVGTGPVLSNSFGLGGQNASIVFLPGGAGLGTADPCARRTNRGGAT